jgi:hypothetical protein
LALLLLACVIPRAVAAWNWDVLWGDSLQYLHASLALEQGNLDAGFSEFGLNIYPLILIPLRHLGVDWQVAGKCYGVLMASLAVLPLWGWLRRMFNDRLALAACLVYALHGKLIAISPLIIRDSTFWFLLALAFYLLWRAVGELRLALFAAAGIVLTLAVHTRTEGWLLLVPLLGWGACRWSTAAGGAASTLGRSGSPWVALGRLRLAAGIMLCVAMIPAAVTVVNVTWLRENPRWEFLRTEHLRIAFDWWNSVSGMHLHAPSQDRPAATPAPAPPTLLTVTAPALAPPNVPSPSAPVPPKIAIAQTLPSPGPDIFTPTVVPPEQPPPGWTLTFKLLERLVKGCTWVGGILLLIGLACSWRIFLRPEHLTLFCMNMLLLAISWVRYWGAGLDLRYFMPIVIVGVPWMALGLEHVIAAASRLLQWRTAVSPRTLRVLAGSVIAVAVACSLLDGPMSAASYMRKHTDLGRWICDRIGSQRTIAGNVDPLALEAFYSNGRVVGLFLPRECLLAPLPAVLAERKADVVVLWTEESSTREYRPMIERRITGCCGYRRVDATELPVAENDVMVFVRGEEPKISAL